MQLTLEQKKLLTQAMLAWIDDNNPARSGNQLAIKAGITNSYVSYIKQGKYQFDNGDRTVVIKDSYFHRVAEAIGYQLESKMHWDFIINFDRITKACRKAQKQAIRMVIDGWTGMGKTHALERYKAANDYVVYVKCTQNMSAKDLLDEMLTALHVNQTVRGNHSKIKMIKNMLLRHRGSLVIIDEVEVVKPGIYAVIKDISDWAQNNAGFVICGMDIISKLDKLADAHRPGFPQLRRRFFGNQVVTASRLTQGEIVQVCEHEKITNTGAQNVLAAVVTDLDMLAQYVADIKAWQEQYGKKITGKELSDLLNISLTSFKTAA